MPLAPSASPHVSNIRLFGSLSVFENVRAPAICIGRPVLAGPRRGRAFREDERPSDAGWTSLLDLFHLLRSRHVQPAASLTVNNAASKSCAAWPPSRRLLLLDEPAAGMNPAEKDELVALISHVHRQFKLSILLVEHSCPS